MIVTAMMRLSIPRMEVAADFYVPLTYSFLAIIAASAVFKEMLWGYWLALALSGLQLISVCYMLVRLQEAFVYTIILDEFSVLISCVTALLLVIKSSRTSRCTRPLVAE